MKIFSYESDMPKPNKTQPTSIDPLTFLKSAVDGQKLTDCLQILEIMQEITHEKPVLWGNIVGFGKYHYKYESGREGDSILAGFSPRKQNITIYIVPGYGYENLPNLKNLGKYKTGKSCLYINKLSEVNIEVLKELIQNSVKYMKEKYK